MYCRIDFIKVISHFLLLCCCIKYQHAVKAFYDRITALGPFQIEPGIFLVDHGAIAPVARQPKQTAGSRFWLVCVHGSVSWIWLWHWRTAWQRNVHHPPLCAAGLLLHHELIFSYDSALCTLMLLKSVILNPSNTNYTTSSTCSSAVPHCLVNVRANSLHKCSFQVSVNPKKIQKNIYILYICPASCLLVSHSNFALV